MTGLLPIGLLALMTRLSEADVPHVPVPEPNHCPYRFACEEVLEGPDNGTVWKERIVTAPGI